MSILAIINELAATSSRLEKEAILKREYDNQLLKDVLVAALNPFTQYWIRKIPEYTINDVAPPDLRWALDGLDKLSSRVFTGNDAVAHLATILTYLSPEDAIVIERIIAKDLRCGVQDSTVNKIWKNLIPTFEVMLAGKFDSKKVRYPCYVQPKLDGLRVLAFVEDDKVTFKSRGGKEFTTLNHIEADILKSGKLNGYVIDGEIISGSFQNTVSDVKRKTVQNTDAVLHAFDLLTIEEFSTQKCSRNQELRNDLLQYKLQDAGIETVKFVPFENAFNEDQVYAWYNKYIDEGYEGAIVKSPIEFYEFKRSKHWQKIKPLETTDVEITGFEEGTGKYVGKLGAFMVDFNGIDCRVGGGFSDDQRTNFWNDKELMVGCIIEVDFMEPTEDGRMRHPRFKRVRSYNGAKV